MASFYFGLFEINFGDWNNLIHMCNIGKKFLWINKNLRKLITLKNSLPYIKYNTDRQTDTHTWCIQIHEHLDSHLAS